MINRRRFVQSSVAAAVAYALPAPKLHALDQAASQAAGGLAAIAAPDPEDDPQGFRSSICGFLTCPPSADQPDIDECERKFAH